MTTLLRRLASRTVDGPQVALHPLARIPFMPAPAPAEELTVTDRAASDVRPEPDRSRSDASGSPPSPPFDLPADAARPESPATSDQRPSQRELGPAVRRLPKEIAAAGDAPREPLLPSTEAVPPRRGAAPPPTARRVVEDSPQSDAAREEVAARPTVGVELTLPRPLVAWQPPPSATPPARLPLTPALDRQPPTAEPSEVHVHIGRVEVTALREAPSPPRERPRRSPQMSLEDYLARRDGSKG